MEEETYCCFIRVLKSYSPSAALYISSPLSVLTRHPGSSVAGWFVAEGQTSDRTRCGGGDPLPAQSGSPAQRH